MTNQITFSDLGLSPSTLDSITQKGFVSPTPVQALTIPLFFGSDNDIIAQAQTGTGKTGAFGIPLIERADETKKHIQALILTPTRELAVQVTDELNSLKGTKNLKIAPIYGGKPIDRQIRELAGGVQIIVGTPGRIIDHIKRKSLNLKALSWLVLDEADEMLNMGFIDAIEEILVHTGENKRTLLFSATMPHKIEQLAKKYLKNHAPVKVEKDFSKASLTSQYYFVLREKDKAEALSTIIDADPLFYGMIFCRTKRDVDHVVDCFIDRGYRAEGIHGDKTQPQREKTLDRFRERKIDMLVASDVAARGIDITGLTHVINFSLPQDSESYVHRVGRTGRAGRQGTAITFVTPDERRRFGYFVKDTKQTVLQGKLPSPAEIIESRIQHFTGVLTNNPGESLNPTCRRWAEQLLEGADAVDTLAALLQRTYGEKLNEENYKRRPQIMQAEELKADRSSGYGKKSAAERRPGARRGGRFERQFDSVDNTRHSNGKERLFVALGKRDKVTVPRLLKMITGEVAISAGQITNAQVMDDFSFITVPGRFSGDIISAFNRPGSRPLIVHAKN